VSYCEWPEFYSETFPKARKAHWCCECAAPIEPGETHLYWRGKWDGEFDTGRQHMLCREVCMELNRPGREKYGECEIAFGQLFDALRDGFMPKRADKDLRLKLAKLKWRHRKHRTIYGRKWGSSRSINNSTQG
jgi:hypothetical protein